VGKPLVSAGALRAFVKVFGGLLAAVSVIEGLPVAPWVAKIIGIVGGALTGWATTSAWDTPNAELPLEWQQADPSVPAVQPIAAESSSTTMDDVNQ
jgi:hypothetical protein